MESLWPQHIVDLKVSGHISDQYFLQCKVNAPWCRTPGSQRLCEGAVSRLKGEGLCTYLSSLSMVKEVMVMRWDVNQILATNNVAINLDLSLMQLNIQLWTLHHDRNLVHIPLTFKCWLPPPLFFFYKI